MEAKSWAQKPEDTQNPNRKSPPAPPAGIPCHWQRLRGMAAPTPTPGGPAVCRKSVHPAGTRLRPSPRASWHPWLPSQGSVQHGPSADGARKNKGDWRENHRRNSEREDEVFGRAEAFQRTFHPAPARSVRLQRDRSEQTGRRAQKAAQSVSVLGRGGSRRGTAPRAMLRDFPRTGVCPGNTRVPPCGAGSKMRGP